MVKVNERIVADSPSSLAQWANRAIRLQGVQVKVRLRGNKLHILCEGLECPDKQTALAQLIWALKSTKLNPLLPANQPPLRQIFLYGRVLHQKRPDWTEQVDLALLYPPYSGQSPSPAAKVPSVQPGLVKLPGQPSGSSRTDSSEDQARKGDPKAIARYLGDSLKSLGVKVKAIARPLPRQEEDLEHPEPSTREALSTPHASLRRLWVFCESAYSPDPSLLAAPIAQKLRQLHLEGFRDAVILSQVTGEATPDWMLRVDLTPPEEMLQDWASWGDAEAIARLLSQALAAQGINVSAVLKESTLHISCHNWNGNGEQSNPLPTTHYPLPIPDRQPCIEAIAPILESLAPRSIYAATIYGHETEDAPPAWVAWLNLPAATDPDLTKSALALAQEGDEAAIAFLLGQLLNPDLDWRLATGGIRIQIRIKEDLLHVMSDAPVCPSQRLVAAPSVQFLRQLEIPGITGVRVYGRRTGQKQPLWRYGADWVTRNRQQPEDAPEFPKSEDYGTELLTEEPEDRVVHPTSVPEDANVSQKPGIKEVGQAILRLLVRSQLFVESDPQQNYAPLPSQIRYQGAKLALVWGAVGILLTVSVDLVLGQILRPKVNQTGEASVIRNSIGSRGSAAQAELPADNEPLTQNSTAPTARRRSRSNAEVFNTEGFTQPGNTRLNLDATGQTATFIRPDPSYPSFNNPQLDEKLALYQQRVAESGPPDVLIVGSSRALRGIDPTALQKALTAQGYGNIEVFNFGVNGATAQVVDLMIRQVVTPEQLPKLIIWADGARAFNSGRADRTYNAIAQSAGYRLLLSGTLPRPSSAETQPGKALEPFTTTAVGSEAGNVGAASKQIESWLNQSLAAASATYPVRDRLQTQLGDAIASTLSDKKNQPQDRLSAGSEKGSDWDGFSPVSIRFDPETYYENHTKVSGEHDKDYNGFQLQGDQAVALESLIQFTQARQIPLIFVNLPLTEKYLDPVRSKYEQEFAIYMLRLSLSREFIYRDWGNLWPKKNEYFSDPSHLNRYGASAIVKRLAQDPLIPWPKRK
jgi:hypothetical protein